VLDHDHDTGRFRGWLCESCNKGIGFMREDIEAILSAADYLRKKQQS